VLRLVAVHQTDGLHVDLGVVAVMDLHAGRWRAVAAGELLSEKDAAVAENVPVHAHPDGDAFLPVQHHRQVAGVTLPEPNADLVLLLVSFDLPQTLSSPPRNF
jgi:hypothetical protein